MVRSVSDYQWPPKCCKPGLPPASGIFSDTASLSGSDPITSVTQSVLAFILIHLKEGHTVFQPAKQNPGRGAPMLIGKGMVVKGRIHSEQDVFLNGEMEGDLNISNYRLIIGPDGKVVANARAREVDISGTLTGNVVSAEKTCIRATGRVTGDVKTRGIVIEEGALFKGTIEIVTQSAPHPEAGNGE
jgi:cytoskeletal protein CcmA (bactofilin family)